MKQITEKITEHTPIQHKNTIKTRPTGVYHGQAIQMHQEIKKDKEILGMEITINATESCMDIPDYTTAEDIKNGMLEDGLLSTLAELFLSGFASTNAKVYTDMVL